ncbi:hypothetical protein [Staphylococcus equorum]|uniref:hypothetical protein n=1 Tax=Staphylococcus equorum TaxID=246432 RepID=UPI003F566CD4
MLFKNKELEQRKEKEKVELIETVVDKFFNYREVVNENQNYLKNRSHHVISNSFRARPQYSVRDAGKVFENEKERNTILASRLEGYSKENFYISESKKIIKTYLDSQAQLKNSIDDLKHFYKVTNYSKSKAKKLVLLENTFIPITEGNSEKADLLPLDELESAYKNIEEFKESHSFRFIERYLQKNSKGNYEVDEQNIYVVNPYYFTDRGNKLMSNLNRKLENTQKMIGKITKNHKTKEQLRRYLQY